MTRERITVGEDERGNQIVYQNNYDGTWTNLLQETAYPDEFVYRHFSHLLGTAYHEAGETSELFEGSGDGKSSEAPVCVSGPSHRSGSAVDLSSLVTA